MRSAALSVQGMTSALYPERADSQRTGVALAWSSVRAPAPVERHQHARFLARVRAHDLVLRTLSDSTWQSRLRDLRARLASSGFTMETSAEAFALVREATRRQLGTPHYDTQLVAGRIMLSNRLAEMATGE